MVFSLFEISIIYQLYYILFVLICKLKMRKINEIQIVILKISATRQSLTMNWNVTTCKPAWQAPRRLSWLWPTHFRFTPGSPSIPIPQGSWNSWHVWHVANNAGMIMTGSLWAHAIGASSLRSYSEAGHNHLPLLTEAGQPVCQRLVGTQFIHLHI